MARFGFLTVNQAARLDGLAVPSIQLALHHLHRHRLVDTITPTCGPGQHPAYALNRRGRTWLARAQALPTVAKARLDGLDESLATVDLALHLEAHGAGRWRTWAEWQFEHAAPGGSKPSEDALVFPPAGVLELPDGAARPIWVLIHRRSPGVLRDTVWALCWQGPFRFGEIYAPPDVCQALERGLLLADLHPWTAPHLDGRPPLLPGWWKTAGAGRGSIRLGPAGAETLRYLDRFGYATATQVARACGRSDIDEMVVLSRLLARGLAQRHGGRRGTRPHAWSATRAGQAAIGSRRQPVPAEPLHRRHSLALNDLAHDLTTQTGGKWEAEREVRTVEGRVKRKTDLLPPPDGRLTLPDGRRIFIQLQLSPGQATRQCLDAHMYRGRGLCDEVWFLCVRDVAPRYRRAMRPGTRA